jgi:hypothetical protein
LPLVNFSESDLSAIRRLIDAERRRTPTLRPRYDEPSQAPDVYLARTPPEGLPAPSYGYTGTGTAYPGTWTGTGTLDTPGVADCDIYRAVKPGLTWTIEPAYHSQEVLNIGPESVAGNTWIVVWRDRYGAWLTAGAPAVGLPDPQASCTHFFTSYGHMRSRDVTLGQEILPRQRLGEIGPHSNGPHLHCALGDGVDMIDGPTWNFCGATVAIEDAMGVPILGDYNDTVPGPEAHTFTHAQLIAIKARIALPLDYTRGWVIIRGSMAHQQHDYYALDLGTPPPAKESTDEIGQAVYNMAWAPDVRSRVVYAHDHGGDIQHVVILEHILGDCEPRATIPPGADLGDIMVGDNVGYSIGPGNIYIARTRPDGIPAPSYGYEGTGTGSYLGMGTWTGTGTIDVPGVADVDVYRVYLYGGTPTFEYVGPLEVLNIGPDAVPGDIWIPVWRDAYGAWFTSYTQGGIGSLRVSDSHVFGQVHTHVDVSGVSHLKFNIADTGIVVQDEGGGEVKVGTIPASVALYGIVSTEHQEFAGLKHFTTGLVVGPGDDVGYDGPVGGLSNEPDDFDTNAIIYFTNLVNEFDESVHEAYLKLGEDGSSSRHVMRCVVVAQLEEGHWDLQIEDAYTTFFVRGLQSNGTTPIPGRFAVRDAAGDDQLGGTAITGGLTFVGGLYISGSAGGGVGTVTSVGITGNDGIGVSGSPITSSGDITLTLGNITPDSVTVPNTGLHLLDTDATHVLIIKPGSNLTADRTLTVTTGDADRTLSLSSSLTIPADPAGDRILFWDDSAGVHAYLNPSTGLTISGVNMVVGGGNVTFDSITTTDSAADFTTSDAGSTNRAAVLRLAHETSGTPSAGFGARINVFLHTDTNALAQAAAEDVEWVSATNASYKARKTYNVQDAAGSREFMRGEATGSAAAVGFLGANAVVRQVVTGSRASGAALVSLLAALVNLGLITDSTTA